MSNTKFKVGDKVRVKTELKCGKFYHMESCMSPDSFEPEMAMLKGKVVTISRVISSGYNIVEDKGYWHWVDEMFEPVFDKIVITTDGKTTCAILYNNQEVSKLAEVKLSKNDEFDFMTSAKLAMERLNTAVIKSNDEIKEGDKVKISSMGLIYLSYLEWVEKHIVSIRDSYRYDLDNEPDREDFFRVIKIAPHGHGDDTLAYINDLTTNRCYLFSIKGLKKA